MTASKLKSAYVPHDIAAPLAGATSGVLSGLTVAIKDMFDIAGERASGGSPAWLEAQQPAQRHSAVVEQVLDAGATIVGKTVCDEFFYSISGVNHHFGTPLNPRAPSRIPGGSSSGSASAASAGSCDIAIGSDTGGSVRVPAAHCGVYGIRTSRGRMNMRGAMSMAPSFDAGGWFSASPGPFALAGKALLRDYKTSEIGISRVAIAKDAFATADEEVAEFTMGFLKSVSHEFGAAMCEITAAGAEIEVWREAFRVTQAYEVWKTFGPFVTERQPALGPGIAERMRVAASITDVDVEASRIVLCRAADRLHQLSSQGTVMVLPTCPAIPPSLEASAEQLEDYRIRTVRLICMASIAGLPQVTLPFGTIDGAPVGISFMGWRGSDEVLLELATRLAPYMGTHASR
jgi:amidase